MKAWAESQIGAAGNQSWITWVNWRMLTRPSRLAEAIRAAMILLTWLVLVRRVVRVMKRAVRLR